MTLIDLKYKYPLTAKEISDAVETLKRRKVAIFIVAYEAEKYITKLLSRIPEELAPHFAEVFIIDDSSPDNTFEIAKEAKTKFNFPNIKVYQTPYNRGYGGNQKLGYLYAIEKNYDVVILLHGDGQYPPEYLARVIAPFKEEEVAAVFASRMITKDYALKGGMPYYKWLGNQALTKIENRMLNLNLSEFHTGYRAYSVKALKEMPFKYNDDGFHFDTEIIIQLVAKKAVMREVPIPTYYGDEVCHVNGMKYALACIRSILWYRLTRLGIFYDRRFDVDLFEKGDYSYKESANTVHQFIIGKRWKAGDKVLNLFAGSGKLAQKIRDKGAEVHAVDKNISAFSDESAGVRILDIDSDFDKDLGGHTYNYVIVLDGLEHLKSVEDTIERIGLVLKPGGTLYACTANVVFFPLRFMFLLGAFNYGKRGILDRTHTRLFAKNAFIRIIENSGFKVRKAHGFGPPLRDMISKKGFWGILDSFLSILAKIRPSLFAYQILIEAKKLDDVETILEKTVGGK